MMEHYTKEMVLHKKEHYKKVLELHMMGQVRSMLELLESHTRHLVHYNRSQGHYIHHHGHSSSRHRNHILFVYGELCLAHLYPRPCFDDASCCVFAFDVVVFASIGAVGR